MDPLAQKIRSVGFVRPNHEKAEVRDFGPELFRFLAGLGVELVAEHGYGSGIGFTPGDYQAADPRVRFAEASECLRQDMVVVLRCPPPEQIEQLRRGATLVSMLHFPTRPERVAMLERLGVHGVAMDQVVDDVGRRVVENLEAVARNGVGAGVNALARRWADFASPRRGPLRALVLGAGAVGAHAMRAAAGYADPALRGELSAQGVPGVEVLAIDVELAGDAEYVQRRLGETDLLVDATQRRDVARPVVRNAWLDRMPAHAVIVDLAADPYDLAASPPRTKAIEGIPHGTLDRYVFEPDDEAWERLDARIPHAARRTACSCYSWPGIRPRESSAVYSAQLQPVLRALIEIGPGALSAAGGRWTERATARALHRNWIPA